MKKIIVAAWLIAATFSVKAWNAAYDKAVYLVAAQNYNPKTLRLVQHYVNEDVTKASNHLSWHRKNGRHLESAGWHKLHLDASLQPAAKDENDAYVQIEKALEIIRNRKDHEDAVVSFAVHTVMNLICDMHNLSNVVIENIPLSQLDDFKVGTSRGTANGRKATITPYSWKSLWTHRYVTYHGAYSPQMWAKDIVIMHGDKKDEFSKGTLKDWAYDIGSYTKDVYGVLETGNGNFLHPTIQKYEELHMSCLARAAYRIAVLLNENLK